ncbi:MULTISPECIES: type II toxin-antitoxin system VapC family toxin [unclassified Nodularia (in: cyanobacteria)]|uniref:type II toxin-antitoxin system VapC family toxin n=1 Tax=unclassified Nodularia (in: cyanobacteria) TaxID=2656917 RepID=UPI00187EFA18|nr:MULTISPECIES: type II toxin-antitoxin system VapC family toxin [unclassified Nodularia (in: cyanobacteria)]MBE9199286.1 type II toxin-antitoxin system VapC family toxin [Nodularia sp. LEGE 06071]MCC2693696.1 type II toxin-antitoxin system VapC family toxin [Nodularia sp. LEGE 04288]
MTSVVADTHTLIWYVFDLQRLSAEALTALEQAVNTGNPIYVSAITIIEIAYLVEKGRFAEEVLTRILNALDDPNIGILLVPLDRNVSGAIRQIDRVTVPDMPDRIIAATAFSLSIPLVTRDLRIQALTTIKTIW